MVGQPERVKKVTTGIPFHPGQVIIVVDRNGGVRRERDTVRKRGKVEGKNVTDVNAVPLYCIMREAENTARGNEEQGGKQESGGEERLISGPLEKRASGSPP